MASWLTRLVTSRCGGVGGEPEVLRQGDEIRLDPMDLSGEMFVVILTAKGYIICTSMGRKHGRRNEDMWARVSRGQITFLTSSPFL